jgi:hypothetical protein
MAPDPDERRPRRCHGLLHRLPGLETVCRDDDVETGQRAQP